MSLIEFYKDVLTSVDLIVSEDGFISIPTSKGSNIVSIRGKNLVLPIKTQVDTLMKVENGVAVPNKVLFNPLNEDMLRGESDSLRHLKDVIDLRLSFKLARIFELLLELGADSDLQKKASLELSSFVGGLGIVKGTANSEAVDAGSTDRWFKIYNAIIKGPKNKGLLHIFLKKSGVNKDVKYNRLAILDLPLYKVLCENEKIPELMGVKLRAKDAKVFKLIYKYIFEGMEDEQIAYGSNDTVSPAFISLYSLYLNVAKRFNFIINQLGKLFEDVKHEEFDLKLTIEDLQNMSKYEKELAHIPSDLEANRSKSILISNSATPTESKVNTISDLAKELLHSNNNNRPQPQAQVTQHNLPLQQSTIPDVKVDLEGLPLAQRLLFGNNPSALNKPQQPVYGISPQQQYQQQQPMYNQVPQNQYGQVQQPMYNQIPQQQYQQQPMYNQMQQQQPMYNQFPQQQQYNQQNQYGQVQQQPYLYNR